MKKTLLLCFLLPLFAAAQDCNLKKETDPITSETKLVTGFVPFNASGYQFSVSMEASLKEINLFFLFENPSPCFKEESTAVAYFAGSKAKVNLKNNAGGSNCQGIFQMMYRNTNPTPVYLTKMSQTKLSSIQFKLNIDDEKLMVVNLSEAQQQRLMEMFACIIKEAKTMGK
jgi:hypothetical protein